MVEAPPLDTLLSFGWVAIFALMFVYGQRIQLSLTLRRIKGKVDALRRMKDEGRAKLLGTLTKFGTPEASVIPVADRLLESFMISPVDLDPRGLVPKLEHVLDVYDNSLKGEVRRLAPEADEATVARLTNLLEVALGLNTMYRVVRHFYLSGKKLGNLIAVVQLQLALPLIMDAAEAYHASLPAFAEGRTIGDGLGPLVANKLAPTAEATELVPDTTVAEAELNGRKLLVVKAKGPGGNVGKPGAAIAKLLDDRGPIALVVMVDAALRLEGEESGRVAEGIGAAIGGPGVERYKIEEAATAKGVPVHALVVKMSEKEAITAIKPELRAAVDQVVERIGKAVEAYSKPGDTVIVAGIGNTLGVS
jgi:hypothetical protein